MQDQDQQQTIDNYIDQEKIINRAGTDICPMEKTVLGIGDPEEAVSAIRAKLADMNILID